MRHESHVIFGKIMRRVASDEIIDNGEKKLKTTDGDVVGAGLATQTEEPQFALPSYEDDEKRTRWIKEAVEKAYYQPDSSSSATTTTLSTQPIVLHCHAEEFQYDAKLLYWPNGQEQGEKLVHLLLDGFGTDAQIDLVNALDSLASGRIDKEETELIIKQTGVTCVRQLGYFRHLALEDYSIRDYSKYVLPPLRDQRLSPHLALIECLLHS